MQWGGNVWEMGGSLVLFCCRVVLEKIAWGLYIFCIVDSVFFSGVAAGVRGGGFCPVFFIVRSFFGDE